MRRITVAPLICLAAVLQVMAQTAPKVSPHEVLKCAGLDGKACTWSQVTDLQTAVVTDDGARKASPGFGKLSLASFDGTLKCEQTDGSRCTAEEVRSLSRTAAQLKLRIWYRFGDALDKR